MNYYFKISSILDSRVSLRANYVDNFDGLIVYHVAKMSHMMCDTYVSHLTQPQRIGHYFII